MKIKQLFLEEVKIKLGNIERAGSDFYNAGEHFATKESKGKLPDDWFLDTTIIIGADGRNLPEIREIEEKGKVKWMYPYGCWGPNIDMNKGGFAEYVIEFDPKVLRRLYQVRLEVNANRDRARLHSKYPGKRAKIYVNNRMVSDFLLVVKTVETIIQDFSWGIPEEKFDYQCTDGKQPKIRDITNFIYKEKKKQEIKLEVDPATMWDVDKLKIHIWINKYKIKNGIKYSFWLIVGAIISKTIPLVISLLRLI